MTKSKKVPIDGTPGAILCPNMTKSPLIPEQNNTKTSEIITFLLKSQSSQDFKLELPVFVCICSGLASASY